MFFSAYRWEKVDLILWIFFRQIFFLYFYLTCDEAVLVHDLNSHGLSRGCLSGPDSSRVQAPFTTRLSLHLSEPLGGETCWTDASGSAVTAPSQIFFLSSFFLHGLVKVLYHTTSIHFLFHSYFFFNKIFLSGGHP